MNLLVKRKEIYFSKRPKFATRVINLNLIFIRTILLIGFFINRPPLVNGGSDYSMLIIMDAMMSIRFYASFTRFLKKYY